MLTIENTRVLGWEPAVHGMRNPLSSWDKSDSTFNDDCLRIGEADIDLMHRLCGGGADDRKFMRMITVYADITAPLYWWKEFDTYKVGTVANSCSTMHTIQKKPFDMNDFSHEHLSDACIGNLEETIGFLELYREKFNAEKDPKKRKWYWWQMIQLLPSSFNQKRTVMLNYEVLVNIYRARKNHKLDEWHTVCDWIETLPLGEDTIVYAVNKGANKNE